MKNIIKLLRIIVMAVVIGFSMTVCDNTTIPGNGDDHLLDVEDLTIARGNGEVKFYWTDPKDTDFDHVDIIRSDGTTRAVTKGTNEYTWDELTNDTSYTFKVKAVYKSDGKSTGVDITGTPVSNSTATPQSEKTLYETAVDVVVLNTSIGSNYRARVIKLKPDQVADTSVTITIADAGIYFDSPNGKTLTLKSIPASAEANDEIIIEFSKDGVKVTHSIEVTIYKSSELSESQTFLLYGYDVINSAYINRDDVKLSTPIISLSKANLVGLIIQKNVNKSTFEKETANSISELYNKLSVGVSAQGSYGLFSAKASTEFSVVNEGKKTNYFSKGRSIQQTKDEWLRNSDPAFLKGFFSNAFINDINSRTAEQLITKYGTHLIKRVYWGGTAEFTYSYSGTELKTENDINVAVQASYSVIKGGVNVANEDKAKKLNNDSKFYAKTVGGKNTYIMNSADDFTANYQGWVDSVASQPDICAIGNFCDCLLPFCELVEQLDPTKAKAVEDEFNNQLAKRGSELKDMVYVEPAYVETKPYIYNLSVGESIPAGYVFVKTGPTGIGGSNLDANNQVKKGSKVVRIGYLRKVEANNHLAIAEIKVVDERTNTAHNLPAGYNYNEGWRAVYSDLNLGNSGVFRYIIYRLVNKNDKYAIDFIGAYDNINRNDGHDLGGKTDWDWVTWHNSTGWADLNKDVGGNYVYLTVHKSPFTWTND